MKNVILIALVMFFQTTFAEKLIFTNNNEQVDITGEAQIDFESGDISVTTIGDHLIVDSNSNAPVILGFYPSDYDISVSSNITVNWTVAFATSCVANVDNGVASWSGSKTASNGSWSQNGVNVSQLPARLKLDCENAGGISTVSYIDLTEQTGGGGGGGSNPSIDTFRVNSQSPSVIINPPGAATITWTTTDVNNCTASATPAVSGWSGSKATSGSQNVTISQNGQLKLNCDSLESTVNITFSVNSSCTASVYPPGLDIRSATYATFNDGMPFGQSTNTSFLLDIGTSEFVSLTEFSFPAINTRRRMVFVDAPSNFNLMDVATISVSECPGDFSPTAICVLPVHNSSTVFITTKSADPTNATNPAFCKVDPTKTYYINYVLSPDPYNVDPECNNASHQTCAIFYSESL